MRTVARILLLAGLAVSVAERAPAQGEPLEGRFVRDEGASDPMQQIVADGMSKLGRLYRVWPIRGQAKRRLEQTNRPYEWIEISPEGTTVTVRTDRFALTTPRDGALEDWERSPGELVDVTTRLEGARLEHVFEAEDGRRVSVYTLSPDGSTLTLHVTVTSPKLDSPLTYRQIYRREG